MNAVVFFLLSLPDVVVMFGVSDMSAVIIVFNVIDVSLSIISLSLSPSNFTLNIFYFLGC